MAHLAFAFNLFLLLAFGPLVWAIVYDMRRTTPWPVRTKRLFLAVLVVLALGSSSISAAEMRNGPGDICPTLDWAHWIVFCLL